MANTVARALVQELLKELSRDQQSEFVNTFPNFDILISDGHLVEEVRDWLLATLNISK